MRISVFLMAMFVCGHAFADESARRNTYVASYTISPNTSQTVSPPTTSRDVIVANGSSNLLCVDPKGGTCNSFCNTSNDVIIPATSSLNLSNFATASLTICGMSASASPVSVVISY